MHIHIDSNEMHWVELYAHTIPKYINVHAAVVSFTWYAKYKYKHKY